MKFRVLVNNGFRYEYETTIEATSVADARKQWQQRSRYSGVVCLCCGASWRTTSSYVDQLRDCSEAEYRIAPGTRGYAAFMVENARHNPLFMGT